MPVVASHDAAWALICIDCAGNARNYQQEMWGIIALFSRVFEKCLLHSDGVHRGQGGKKGVEDEHPAWRESGEYGGGVA